MLLRPIKKDDVDLWLAFVSKLSTRTKYLRLRSLPRLGREDAIRFCTVDYTNAFALVAEALGNQQRDIVAIGRYCRLPRKHSAEVAFVIQDTHQGKGIGTKLMEWLADTKAVEDLLLRLSALIEHIPEIAELDLNPVKVMPRGERYCVVDARVMLR